VKKLYFYIFGMRIFCLLSIISCLSFLSFIQADGLADGSDAGTLDGTLWTPGRLNGVVNEASWEIVPQNKWIQVANTRLDTSESQITSAIPGWRDPSVSKWVGVTEAWNGVAYDVWFYRVLPQGDNAVSALGEESIAYYDQSRDQVLALSCGSGGPWSNTFNMSNNKWTGENVIGHGWDWSGAADYRHNNTVTLFKAVEAEDTYASPGRYVSYDIVTRQVHVSGEVQYGPSVKREDFYPTDGNGMVYIPPLNRYWVVQTNATSRDLTWLELDPTTTPWTYSFLKFDSPTPALTGSTLVRRRMIWLPNLNAIVWLGSADKNVQVYKIGDYTPFTPYYVPIDRAPIAGPQSSNPSSQQSPSSQPPSSSVTNSATPVQFSVGLLISAVFALCSNTLI
jgi:hypothetical protein